MQEEIFAEAKWVTGVQLNRFGGAFPSLCPLSKCHLNYNTADHGRTICGHNNHHHGIKLWGLKLMRLSRDPLLFARGPHLDYLQFIWGDVSLIN